MPDGYQESVYRGRPGAAPLERELKSDSAYPKTLAVSSMPARHAHARARPLTHTGPWASLGSATLGGQTVMRFGGLAR